MITTMQSLEALELFLSANLGLPSPLSKEQLIEINNYLFKSEKETLPEHIDEYFDNIVELVSMKQIITEKKFKTIGALSNYLHGLRKLNYTISQMPAEPCLEDLYIRMQRQDKGDYILNNGLIK